MSILSKQSLKHLSLSEFVRKHFVYRIFLTYFSVFAAILIIVLIVNGYRMSRQELQQGIHSGTTLLNQTSSYLQYRVQEINGIINVISYNDSIKQALIDGENYYSHSVANWNIQTSQGTKEIYYGSYMSKDISKIRLYSTKGDLSFESTTLFQSLSEDKQEEWRQRLNNLEGNYMWVPSSVLQDNEQEQSIYLVNRIAALDNMRKYLGYIISTIPETTFTEIIEQGSMTKGTAVLLFNSYNEIIVQNSTCKSDFTPLIVQNLANQYQLNTKEDLKEITYQGQTFLMGIRSIEKSDWKVAMLVPSSDLLATSNQFIRQMVISLIIIMLLSLPLIYLISRSLTSRIIHLKDMMTTFSLGHKVELENSHDNDEITDLTNSFFHMQEHIEDLMQEQYRQGFEIKDLELQVLQSQINPHFLYNTLDLIYWMGVKNNAPDISTAAAELGQFYKLSLGQGEKIVSIEDEIRHIEAYIKLQNMRFHNSINFQNDVPIYLYSYQIIKVTLQPLIENAINHGIREKENECGTILLSGNKIADKLYLSIQDDGIGMPPEQLLNICKKRTHSAGHGYGVWNINERIKLTYGEEYGLQYQSVPGQGTTVTILLPALLKEEHLDDNFSAYS